MSFSKVQPRLQPAAVAYSQLPSANVAVGLNFNVPKSLLLADERAVCAQRMMLVVITALIILTTEWNSTKRLTKPLRPLLIYLFHYPFVLQR